MFRLFAFLIFMLCGSTTLLAAEWSDLWLTKNQQAKKAFDAGNYAEAIELLKHENKPRYPNIKWYIEAIGLDYKEVINKIN